MMDDEKSLQQFNEDYKIPRFELIRLLDEEQADLPEVKQLTAYINDLRLYEEDYSPSKWREVIAKPTKLLGFGKLADWYQFTVQRKNDMIFEAELQKSKSKLHRYVHISKLSLVNGGLKPEDVDWDDLEEVDDLDLEDSRFNEKDIRFELKIDLKKNEYVTMSVHAQSWELYPASYEGSKYGDDGLLQVIVTNTNCNSLEQYNNLVVMNHSQNDESFDAEWEKIRVSMPFFKALSSATKVKVMPKTIVKFIIDTCQYPFTLSDCDWQESLEEIAATQQAIFTYDHIKNEIAANVPDALAIFEKDYLPREEHLKVLDYFILLSLKKARQEHCKFMVLLSLQDNTLFDFSAATDLIMKHTTWHQVSDKTSCYEMEIINEETNELELTVLVKSTFVWGKATVIEITATAKKVPHRRSYLQIKFIVDQLGDLDKNVTAQLKLLAESMHLDWSVNQFWKFLYEMLNCEEDTTAGFDGFNPDLTCFSIKDEEIDDDNDVERDACKDIGIEDEDFFGDHVDSENRVEIVTMELDEEIADLRMDIEPKLLNSIDEFLATKDRPINVLRGALRGDTKKKE